MRLQEQGEAKYGDRDLLASSAGSGWRGMAAEHRHHPRGEVGSFAPQHLEIAIATGCDPECVVSRTGDRLRQHTRVAAGTIWFCPTGVQEEDIVVSQWHDALHIYVPPARFAELSDARGGAAHRPEAVPYIGGLYDERIRRLGSGLLRHLEAPGAAGAVLLDTVSLELTACIVDGYSADGHHSAANDGRHRLDDRRLRRVFDYMTAHLEDDVGLDDLAEAACFSPFHFIRAFAETMGMPPHRYLSRLRLERAKSLLSLGTMPIAEIAVACCFSSQSSFTRAFGRATGLTPLAYRQQAS